ncbi:UDP-N-acetylglucosamine 2-epimerase (non-hydrolysing) [Actinopolymorpha cephalotaxi]|uniref:UDP-N-acetylglucosamine 2-epimerase (Non-hydrolysing) n=2 Tax=Actinopolymorpha cephalotaxi TaxID=504797 RepID=A0A1I2T7U7_9ACTN|nr:UDP-N-acetylglucosamine 2-epimerase (non-hydrolyzing) [Actinopolymorpha cephalotaxi]SFG60988.1 UDP-N-acetylglucosamine 2-epimerase (non-hydrolysing) [Actinopolymorpha cephalotaxi]
MKVMTVVGTRPEIIRLSRVIPHLDSTVGHVLVHTGQNYAYTLSDIFFDELRLRRPDHYLGVDTSTLGRMLGDTLIKVEEILVAERPDALLVLGDTNSSIAALMAKRLRIPVFHMEAGNRCFDENVPEETNRRLIDHIADFNLVYTEHARRNLLAEGIQPRRVLLTGSPMKEVLDHYRPQVEVSTVLDRLSVTSGEFFVVSAHREENVDNPQRLRRLLECITNLRDRWALPVIVSTHPRTRKRMEALEGWSSPDRVNFCEPFGFFDYVKLQLAAFCVVSDSGTISEEASILGFPAVTLRTSVERPEALDAGAVVTAGLDVSTVVAAVELVTSGSRNDAPSIAPPEYLVADCSRRTVRFILGTTHAYREITGIRDGAGDHLR